MKNDQKYLELMALYKKVRRNPKNSSKAQEILDKALELGRKDVSPEAKEAARYM